MHEDELSHVDAAGRLRMVDVSAKPVTRRTATVSGRVVTAAPAPDDLVLAARLAGILAAKRTSALVPLCHPLEVDDVRVDVVGRAWGYDVRTAVTSTGRTGVEMEALTAAAFCALELTLGLRATGHGAAVEALVVVEKRGGRSEWGSATTSEPPITPTREGPAQR